MSAPSFTPDSPTPLLSEKYSGVPKRLTPEAKRIKKLLYSNKTAEEQSSRSKTVPVLPPDTTRDAFNAAIKDLKSLVGDQNVEINDKPLIDGWYMEHPYAGRTAVNKGVP